MKGLEENIQTEERLARIKKFILTDEQLAEHPFFKEDGDSVYVFELNKGEKKPEPSFSEEIDYLLSKGFSKQDILNHSLYRSIHQYQRDNVQRTSEGCEKYLQDFIYPFHKLSGWSKKDLDAW